MAVYTNPPLVSVNYSIWWHLLSRRDIANSANIPGMLYPHLIEEFPKKQAAPNLPQIGQSRRTVPYYCSEDERLFLVITNQELRIISVEKNYSWDNFGSRIDKYLEKLFSILKDLVEVNHFHLELEYCDFYRFDRQQSSFKEFLEKTLTLSVDYTFVPDELSIVDFRSYMSFAYEKGTTSYEFGFGEVDTEEGLISTIACDSNTIEPDINEIKSWNSEAHDICSKSFERIITPSYKNSIV